MTSSLAARAWRGRRANSALSKPSVNRRRPGCRVLGRAPAPLTRSNSSITQRSSVSSDRAIACSTVSRPRSTSPASPRQAVSLPPSSTKRGRNPARPLVQARCATPAARRPDRRVWRSPSQGSTAPGQWLSDGSRLWLKDGIVARGCLRMYPLRPVGLHSRTAASFSLSHAASPAARRRRERYRARCSELR